MRFHSTFRAVISSVSFATIFAAAPQVYAGAKDVPAKTAPPKPAPVTAADQGSSAAEMKITATIRKALMANQSLSFAAQNATVITIGSTVTLRGSVATAAEKTWIEAMAKKTAGVTAVDCLLEVSK